MLQIITYNFISSFEKLWSPVPAIIVTTEEHVVMTPATALPTPSECTVNMSRVSVATHICVFDFE